MHKEIKLLREKSRYVGLRLSILIYEIMAVILLIGLAGAIGQNNAAGSFGIIGLIVPAVILGELGLILVDIADRAADKETAEYLKRIERNLVDLRIAAQQTAGNKDGTASASP